MSERQWNTKDETIDAKDAEIARLKSGLYFESVEKPVNPLVVDMVDFVLNAQHDAGCNYPYAETYGCKCGLKDLQERIKSLKETEK